MVNLPCHHSSTLPILPAQQVALQGTSESEQHHDEHQHQDDQRKGQFGIIGALGKRQQIAQATTGGDELAHHGAGEGKAHRHLEAAHHPGHR